MSANENKQDLPSSVRKHIVITGTGRAGTTVLVKLFGELGFETGSDRDSTKYYQTARAGLEFDIREDDAPYVVKHPQFSSYVDEVLARSDIEIEHVLIPIRDINAVTESRWRVVKESRKKMDIIRKLFKRSSKIPGGLLYTDNKSKQSKILLEVFFNLLLSLSRSNIPVTFVNYPLSVKDPSYLYKKLKPIIGDIGFDRFISTHQRVVDSKLVHSFNDKDK